MPRVGVWGRGRERVGLVINRLWSVKVELGPGKPVGPGKGTGQGIGLGPDKRLGPEKR